MTEERKRFRPFAALGVAVVTMAPFPVYASIECHTSRAFLYVLLGLLVAGMFGAGVVFAGVERLWYALLFAVGLVPVGLAAAFVAFFFSFGRCFTF